MSIAAVKQIDLVGQVSRIVSDIAGIQLGERQRTMVESRLKKRMIQLGITSDEEYLKHLVANKDSETNSLVSILTTHHTYFFREFSHFEYLDEKALSVLVENARSRGDRKIRIWSAACSRGQEVYSLSMFLKTHLAQTAPDVNYEILGTDVDSESVDFAKNGVYARHEIKEVPLKYLSAHWARGTGEIAEFVKAKTSIKSVCQFRRVNLLEVEKEVFTKKFDVIFCRNVFIYFNPSQIMGITSALLKNLDLKGFLFIGISESLTGMGLPVSSLGPSIYSHPFQAQSSPKSVSSSKKSGTDALSSPGARPSLSLLSSSASASSASASSAAAAPKPKDPLRVLCVDDSPSVLALLKRVLTSEFGFNVVATAANGLEAAEKMRTQQFDLMTLDIHMPGQTGLEYLQKNFKANHPPVVMISSVSRENADLAMNCLQSGASDYVEKPTLPDLAARSEEIRNKLKSAWRSKNTSINTASGSRRSLSQVDKDFSKKIQLNHPEKQFRLVIAGLSDQDSLRLIFSELPGVQPPTVVLFEGAGETLSTFAHDFSLKKGGVVRTAEEIPVPTHSQITFGDFGKEFDRIQAQFKNRCTSILILGLPSQNVAKKLMTWKGAQTLMENPDFTYPATDIVPITSFAYMSLEFLEKNTK